MAEPTLAEFGAGEAGSRRAGKYIYMTFDAESYAYIPGALITRKKM